MVGSDVPDSSSVHWLVNNIPAGRQTLTPNSLPGTQQGRNGAGRTGYIGPCPPPAGLVIRCLHCESVLIRVVHGPGRYWLDLHGVSCLEIFERA